MAVAYQSVEERIGRLEVLVSTFVQHVDQDIAEMREWRLQAQKQWGELAQKLGKFVEDVVAPNVPRIAQQVLGLGDEIFAGARLRLYHPQERGRMREFDYVYAAHKGWIVIESRNDPKLKDVESFREMLAEAGQYFPQYAPLPLYAIFASLSIPDHVVQYCTKQRIYALGLGPETMQLLNLAQLSGPSHPPASQRDSGHS